MIEALARLLGEIFVLFLDDLVGETGRLALRAFGIRRERDSGLAFLIGSVLLAFVLIAGLIAWQMAVG